MTASDPRRNAAVAQALLRRLDADQFVTRNYHSHPHMEAVITHSIRVGAHQPLKIEQVDHLKDVMRTGSPEQIIEAATHSAGGTLLSGSETADTVTAVLSDVLKDRMLGDKPVSVTLNPSEDQAPGSDPAHVGIYRRDYDTMIAFAPELLPALKEGLQRLVPSKGHSVT